MVGDIAANYTMDAVGDLIVFNVVGIPEDASIKITVGFADKAIVANKMDRQPVEMIE